MSNQKTPQQILELLKKPKSLAGLVIVVLGLVATQDPMQLFESFTDQGQTTSESSQQVASNQSNEASTSGQSVTSQSVSTDTSGVVVEEGQAYTSPEEVAAYIDQYDKLPVNYITKDEAEELGWVSNQGNLWEVTDQMSIGGDHFGNYEEVLPTDDEYREADVNYEGGFRGSERLIYSDDGDIYYTDDHYETFEQLY
ncbi:ribonuclease domain-containing protein [Aerococcus sp. 1KP-2016]|uniref:ribonuclease domain-containing protein n=1 Tax=Aerococcus sp. 1KP-2016 TaxID=1981982 RepID=UPI000B9945C6|nr:ribonuclease domain-containing protein [Aerococcus sp. 1KP-2016]OYQ68048.1 ribonuclease [Aerococcus sp. 1KP-2016]